MITWDDVVAVAPELGACPAPAVTAILAQVAAQLASEVWGARLATGQTYLAAHLATIRGKPGFQSEQIGEHRRDTTGDLEATAYGREFRRLCRTLPLALMTVT